MSEKQELTGRFRDWLERLKEKAREGAAIQARVKRQRADNARRKKHGSGTGAGTPGGFGGI